MSSSEPAVITTYENAVLTTLSSPNQIEVVSQVALDAEADADDGGGSIDGGVDGGELDELKLAANRKKRAKKKAAAAKKKEAGSVVGAGVVATGSSERVFGVPSRLPSEGQRVVGGFCDSYVSMGQTFPPTIPVSQLFIGGRCPSGQEMEYSGGAGASARVSSEELRALDRAKHGDVLEQLREAAEVHRQVRKFAQSIIKPGLRLADMCHQIEEMNRTLVRESGLARGIAFPTGCSLNHVAAHYTPNPGDETVLAWGDVMKVDFGTQIAGRIIDCAWTVAFDPQFDPLLLAVKEATDAGIRAAGIDARLGEIGGAIQEVMESHEVEINGKTHRVRSIRNLNGHSIAPYKIHAGKSVPIVRTEEMTRMEEGEHYAIETFGSTGRASVWEDGETSHYMRNWEPSGTRAVVRLPRAKTLLADLDKTFGTLAFCPRWLELPHGGSATVNCGRQEKYAAALKHLVDTRAINAYPPLVDVRGSYTAQYEHTIYLKPSCKEVLSRGDDY